MNKKTDKKAAASSKKNPAVENPPIVKAIVKQNNLTSTDPFGSYTGKPQDPKEIPSQDQDDL